MLLDRSPIRESGSSDAHRPSPAGDFDGTTRREAMKALLAKHVEPSDELDRVPAHAFWSKRLRRTLGLAVIACALANTAHAQGRISFTSSAPRLTPQEAADILRPHQYVAPPPAPDGPHVYVINSTPGAASWLTFPPETPRRRLDGTLLSDPPTVYGFNPFFVPVLTYPVHSEHARPRK